MALITVGEAMATVFQTKSDKAEAQKRQMRDLSTSYQLLSHCNASV